MQTILMNKNNNSVMHASHILSQKLLYFDKSRSILYLVTRIDYEDYFLK